MTASFAPACEVQVSRLQLIKLLPSVCKGNPQTGEAGHNLVVCEGFAGAGALPPCPRGARGALLHQGWFAVRHSRSLECWKCPFSRVTCSHLLSQQPVWALAWAGMAPFSDQHCTMGSLLGLQGAPLPAALVPAAAAGPVCGRNLCIPTLKGCLSPAGADLEWVRWHQHCSKSAVFQCITQTPCLQKAQDIS